MHGHSHVFHVDSANSFYLYLKYEINFNVYYNIQ